jgi:hypothetical protein
MMMRSTTRMPTQMPITAVIGMPGGSGKLGVFEGDELGSVGDEDVLDWLSEVEVLLDGFWDRLGDGLAGVLVGEEIDSWESVEVDVGFGRPVISAPGLETGPGVELGVFSGGACEDG